MIATLSSIRPTFITKKLTLNVLPLG